MNPALIDTNILSLFFRKNPNVIARFNAYLKKYDKLNISIITYYEIISGLKHRDAQKQLKSFLEFAEYNTVLPLTERSATISADIYANLRSKGMPIDDIDILIAGIAIANNLVVVTNNRKDFEKIQNLDIEDWSQSE